MKSPTLTLLITGTTLLSLASCSHKQSTPEQSSPDAQLTTSSTAPLLIPMDLEMAHFAFNSAVLTKVGKLVLRKDAQDLKASPDVKIEAQGYCDDRGSVQYNLALGERRALAVKKYMESLGVSGDRITTISYGKADPLDSRNNEKAWSMNRRASFVVIQMERKKLVLQ